MGEMKIARKDEERGQEKEKEITRTVQHSTAQHTTPRHTTPHHTTHNTPHHKRLSVLTLSALLEFLRFFLNSRNQLNISVWAVFLIVGYGVGGAL